MAVYALAQNGIPITRKLLDAYDRDTRGSSYRVVITYGILAPTDHHAEAVERLTQNGIPITRELLDAYDGETRPHSQYRTAITYGIVAPT